MYHLWMDLETTGLDPQQDEILEIAWTITGSDYWRHNGDTIKSRLIRLSDNGANRIGSNEYVMRMHESTGLLDEVEDDTKVSTLSDVHEEIVQDMWEYSDGSLDKNQWQLSGIGVHFDLEFLKVYMPRLTDDYLSYRVFNVRTLIDFFYTMGMAQPPRTLPEHRAAPDVLEAIRVTQYFAQRVRGMKGLLNDIDRMTDAYRKSL